MNPLIREAAQAMPAGAGVVMGTVSVLFMGLFLAWFWYAYAPKRADLMQAYGRLPFDDESET